MSLKIATGEITEEIDEEKVAGRTKRAGSAGQATCTRIPFANHARLTARDIRFDDARQVPDDAEGCLKVRGIRRRAALVRSGRAAFAAGDADALRPVLERLVSKVPSCSVNR